MTENPNQTIPFPFCSICGAQMPDNKKSTLVLHKKVEHSKELARMKRKKRINLLCYFSIFTMLIGLPAFSILSTNISTTPEDSKCYDMEHKIDSKIANHNFVNLDSDLEKMNGQCSNVIVSFYKGIKSNNENPVIAP